MLDILVRFPIRRSMASPFDEISDRASSSSSAFGVKYLINFIFILVIDDNRWRESCALTLIRVRNRRFQKANMEDRVYVHPCREFELVCVRAHNLYHFEWAKVLPVKLLRKALSNDIFGVQSHFVVHLVNRDWITGSVSIIFIFGLCETHFGTEYLFN